MDSVLLLFMILVFVAAFLAVERLLALTVGPQRREAKEFKRRLDFVAKSQQVGTASLLRQAHSISTSRFGTWPGVAIIDRYLRGAGYKLNPFQAIAICLAVGAAGFGLFWYVVADPLLAAIGGAGLAAALPVKLSFDYKARVQQFEEGLVEAIDVMVRALKAGRPFNESMLLVAEELEGPVGEEFGATFAELNYGLSPQQALVHMVERVPSITLKALVVAVLLQRETGGNLSELLEKINRLLRARFRFQRKVRTLSAEGRLSAVILTAVPFVLFGMIYLTTPTYVTVLTENPIGHKLIIISGILMVIGFLWVRKLVRIDL